jgi:DNA-binding XRE family transcriptional regulator
MKIAEWMLSFELSDEGVAKLVGVDRTAISRLRRGLTRPSWELAGKIREASGGLVTPNDFLEAAE